MSVARLINASPEDSRVLWRAILSFDDAGIADSLFWLVAHQRMTAPEAAAVELALRPTIAERCWQSIRPPYYIQLWMIIAICCELLLAILFSFHLHKYYTAIGLSFMVKTIFLALTLLIAYLYWNSKAESTIPENWTWEQCLEAHPKLLQKLRRDSLRSRIPAPSDRELAVAIRRSVDKAKVVVESQNGDAAPLSRMWLGKLDESREMIEYFPTDIPNSDIPTWVSELSASDWRRRFNARLVIQSMGADTLPDLWRAKRRRLLRRIAKRLIGEVIQDNQSRFVHPASFVCGQCFSRFQSSMIVRDGEPRHAEFRSGQPAAVRYSVCRRCKSARHACETTKVVCVIGKSSILEHLRDAATALSGDRQDIKHVGLISAPFAANNRGGSARRVHFEELAVSWSLVRRPFDFDIVHVGLTEDWEIEQFAAALHAHDDFVRNRHNRRIAVRFEHHHGLSANSWTILTRLFPHAFRHDSRQIVFRGPSR